MAAGQQRAHAAAAAPDEHSLECRRFEVAGVAVDIRQDLKGSNALRPLDDDRVWAGDEGEEVGAPILTGATSLLCALEGWGGWGAWGREVLPLLSEPPLP